MPRNFTSIVLLGVVIVAALWFLDSPPPQFQSSPEPASDAFVLTQYFNNIDTVQYNSQGLPEQRFQSKRIEHQTLAGTDSVDEKGRALMQLPDISFYQDGEVRWRINSLSGESNLNEEKIHLQNQVALNQLGRDDAWSIETESLWIDPSQQTAHTEAPVKLQTRGILSTGVGMKADLIEESIEVLADTKTYYDPSL
jgi:LPS export ABC transporter protein LptC